jgi:outer membrane biosynthesis protein TonB
MRRAARPILPTVYPFGQFHTDSIHNYLAKIEEARTRKGNANMKKSHIFAAIFVLSVSPMAIAQTAPPPPDAPSSPAPETPPAPEAPPAPDQPPMADSPAAPAAPAPAPAPEATPAPPPPSEPVMQPSAAPAPTSAMDKDYPVCSRTVTDNCRNASEGGTKKKARKKK